MDEKKQKFYVKLEDAWKQAGEPSFYSIRKKTGISWKTIERYVTGIYLSQIDTTLVDLAQFFGVSWKDYVEEMEAPELKTPLPAL